MIQNRYVIACNQIKVSYTNAYCCAAPDKQFAIAPLCSCWLKDKCPGRAALQELRTLHATLEHLQSSQQNKIQQGRKGDDATSYGLLQKLDQLRHVG